ncbi:MAG: transcription antitermination factor NusB [Chlamydiota bacterium]
MTAREAAYKAVLASLRGSLYATDTLEQWQRHSSPSAPDYNLAREIASGTLKRALTLDYYARQLAGSSKLKVKLQERALLRTALYQHYFMDRIPLYAIIDESLKIATKHCRPRFKAFLHAILANISRVTIEPPTSWDVAYSYPSYFIDELLASYSLEVVKDILAAGNATPSTTVRIRQKDLPHIEGLKYCSEKLAVIKDSKLIPFLSQSQGYYIQNLTPATLMATLQDKICTPSTILDLCAAPGGKTLAAHDLFPNATLYANDVSQQKLSLLKENFDKYGLDVHLTCSQGQNLQTEEKFDLVIVDVPCSNSGTLARRAEARWRLSPDNIHNLNKTQQQLIAHSSNLLKTGGYLAYLTCSILPTENQALYHWASHHCPLENCFQKTITPNSEGYDGGYLGLLRKK